jgi:hypothetical protein
MLLEIRASERAAAPGGRFLSAETSNQFAVRFMVAAGGWRPFMELRHYNTLVNKIRKHGDLQGLLSSPAE